MRKSTVTVGKENSPNTSILKRTRLGDENSNPDNDNIDVILPNRNFTYHEPIENEGNDNINQFMVVSNNIPKDNTFLTYKDYKDGSGVIEWTSRNTNSTNFEDNSRKTIDLLDPGYILALKNDSNTSKYLINDKYEWVSIHACVSDIGLNQIAWNTNENYNILESNNSNNTLKINTDNDLDNSLNCKIYYINSSKELKYKEDTITNLNNSLNDVFKVNSAEITKGINKANVEFSFEVQKSQESNAILKLNLIKKSNTDTCFDYNEEYFTNPQFNSFLDNSTDIQDATITSGENTIIDEIESNLKVVNKDSNLSDFFLLVENGEYELEGGTGRKASINITEKSDTSLKIQIKNPGYLYLNKDELRFKTTGDLRDNYYFKVEGLGDSTNQTTNYVQEFIKAGAGKSNTIKRAFATGELFVTKSLQISGSVKGYLLVRLIKLKNIFDSNIAQQTIKEVYYYKRDNINDTFDINTVYEENTELYIDIQKIIRTDDNTNDDDDRSTLNFSLNGILYNSNPSEHS